jgi:hypothetical protein
MVPYGLACAADSRLCATVGLIFCGLISVLPVALAADPEEFSVPKNPVSEGCCGKYALYEDPVPLGRMQFSASQPVVTAATLTESAPFIAALSAPTSFTNLTAFTITDCPNPCGASGQAASLYPSTITVSGLTGVVERVSVKLNGFTHGFPADVDMLLVSPSGRKVVIMSDFGAGSPGVSNINVTLDDYAASPVPSTVAGNTGRPFVSGTYRPSNSGTTDQFPAPAPAGPFAYSLSQFNGDDPNGTWSLYIMDDANLDGGTMNGGWELTFDVRPPAPARGDVLISEFRTRGVGTTPPDSDGAADEFIELYNNTDESITIIDAIPGADPTLGAGTGWRIAAAQGATESAFNLISQTSSASGPLAIPPRGYFLIATQPSAPSPAGNTYSLAAYPTGTGITASGSANFTINPVSAEVGFLTDDAGLALFSTANSITSYRLDSVGFSSVTKANHKEGAGLAPATGITTAGQHSWVRKMAGGVVVDTDDNANDFQLVETTGAALNGVPAVLGAPGPQRAPTSTSFTTTSAPIHAAGAGNMPLAVIDSQQAFGSEPNALYDATPITNGANGTIKFRARFTNNSGLALVSLRYRVVSLSTLEGGTVPTGQADLRVLNSPSQSISLTDASMVNAQALTVQTPAAQASGGGVNSSLSEGVITTMAPLANGASTVVEFNLGVEQFGNFRFGVLAEGLNIMLQGVSGSFYAAGSVGPGGLVVAAPQSSDDAGFTSGQKTIEVDVLANDAAAPGDVITIATAPLYGTATVVDGKIRYVPYRLLPLTGDVFAYTYNGVLQTVTIYDFISLAGTYDALLEDPGATPGLQAHDRAGRVQVTIGKSGSVSGRAMVAGGGARAFRGKLGASGDFVQNVSRPPDDPVQVRLNFDPAVAAMVGNAQSSDSADQPFTSTFTLGRKVPAGPLAQRYTFLVDPTGVPDSPNGSGFGALKVTPTGDVTIRGKLADGSPLASGGFLHAGNSFPIYASPYGGRGARGSLRGELQFMALAVGDATGTLGWFKPARPDDVRFPAGFTLDPSGRIDSYFKPAAASRVIGFSNGVGNGHILLSDGGFPAMDETFTLLANNKVVPPNPNPSKLSIRINASTGLFQGTFLNPENNKKTPIQGAVFQDDVTAFGYFLGVDPTESGSVYLEPR